MKHFEKWSTKRKKSGSRRKRKIKNKSVLELCQHQGFFHSFIAIECLLLCVCTLFSLHSSNVCTCFGILPFVHLCIFLLIQISNACHDLVFLLDCYTIAIIIIVLALWFSFLSLITAIFSRSPSFRPVGAYSCFLYKFFLLHHVYLFVLKLVWCYITLLFDRFRFIIWILFLFFIVLPFLLFSFQSPFYCSMLIRLFHFIIENAVVASDCYCNICVHFDSQNYSKNVLPVCLVFVYYTIYDLILFSSLSGWVRIKTKIYPMYVLLTR